MNLGVFGAAHSNDDLSVSATPAVEMVNGLTASNQNVGDSSKDGTDLSGSPCVGSPTCTGTPPDPVYVLDTTVEQLDYEAANSSVPMESIPTINPADYAQKVADLGLSAYGYILHNDGTVTTGPGVICGTNGLCTGGAPVSPLPAGWAFTGWGKWAISSNVAADGVFYSESAVQVTGSPGTSILPWQATIIALDSITISGSPHIKPYPTTSTDLQNHLLLAGNDLKITGNVTANYAGGALRFF